MRDNFGVGKEAGSPPPVIPNKPVIPTKERHPCENRGWNPVKHSSPASARAGPRSGTRPPGKVEVQILSGTSICRPPGKVEVQILSGTSVCRPPGKVEVQILSGTSVCRPPGKVEVQIAAPAHPAPAAYMPSVAILPGAKICQNRKSKGDRRPRRRVMSWLRHMFYWIIGSSPIMTGRRAGGQEGGNGAKW